MIVALPVFIIFIICVAFAIIKYSKKSCSHLVEELKYEIIYNVLGFKAVLDDFALRSKDMTFDQPVGTGKVALITGGARGIGVEVVKSLVGCDFQVIIGCRNLEAGYAVIKNIRAEGITNGDMCVYKLDLSSLESVKSFAAEVKQNHPKIHLLINNAGKMFGPRSETIDGYESQFATNYLGHFLLTHLLLSEIKAAGTSWNKARIVNVTSCAHLCGDIDFNDINQKIQYISSKAYAQSKLAQVLFTNYLNTLMRNEGAPVAVYSLHPGIVNTDLFNGTFLKILAPWVPRLFFLTPKQGSLTTVFTCISPTIENSGGSYLNNCRILPTHRIAYSTILQEKLFEFTNNLLGIKKFGEV